MFKKEKYFICMAILFLLMGISASAAEKQTLYNSPYVTFAPDGKAWTTNAGEKDYEWYDNGTMVTTGIYSTIRKLQTGEHYYKAERRGEVPIGFWRVEHRPGTCIHDAYPGEDLDYHGIPYGKSKCRKYYYSGWEAYCADCGECIADILMYMSREAAESIDYMYLGNKKDFAYYYLCPYCTNLEQGANLEVHMCKAISWNQYKVRYEPNNNFQPYGGYMAESIHMYNNDVEYEGKSVTPITHLSKNMYTRIGYEFIGWNTMPDGSGIAYKDESEILNLTIEDRHDGEGKGIVILYAQWRPSASTLIIDAAGGTYNGNGSCTVVKSYLNSFTVQNHLIQAPAGYRVSFEMNGGIPLSPVVSTRHFTEWSINPDYRGDWYNGTYFFIAPDGNIDTLTANYALDPVTLPKAVKPGSSFGGWFYDPDFRQPAGGTGDTIIPAKDTTLYAQWVDLTLYAKDNYAVNGGKGAVDLSWTQSDGRNKTYLLYQSRDGVNWTRISAANDISNSHSVDQSYGFTGDSQSFTVPYTGLYVLTGEGAQGSSYDIYQGGLGGKVAAKVWLRKGEIVSYTIGGRNGFHGGGSADRFANGGGCTMISTNLKGTVLIAGGGGGASPMGNGGAGGSNASVTGNASASGSAGQSGGAGGGGGYQGGGAGELIVHHHTEACYRNTDKNILATAIKAENINENYILGYDSDDDPQYAKKITQCYGSRKDPIQTEGATNLQLEARQEHRWGNSGQIISTDISGIQVYDQNGTLIYSQNLSQLEDFVRKEYKRAPSGNTRAAGVVESATMKIHNDLDGDMEYNNTEYTWLHYNEDGTVTKYRTLLADRDQPYYEDVNGVTYPLYNPGEYFVPEISSSGDNGWWGQTIYIQRVNVPVPAGTTGIYIEYTACSVENHGLPRAQVNTACLSGGKQLICGMEEGRVISSKPAYGGSNYVNAGYAYSYRDTAGMRAGNGAVSIRSEQIGFVDALNLNGVTAADLAAPGRIDTATVTKEPAGGDRVRITWQEPGDNGTDYCHLAESYLIGSTWPLCKSNVTKNTLTSGIKGYYYTVNGNSGTTVTARNSGFTGECDLTVPVTGQAQYLHVAAVDAAGNLGGTSHIRIEAGDVLWKLYTRQLVIDAEENVYPADMDRTWYVRADGTAPFTLHHSAYLEGTATARYQPNYTIYETITEGKTARNIIYTPSKEISGEEIRTDAEGLTYFTDGTPVLMQFPYSYTVKSNFGRQLKGIQKFTVEPSANGKHIKVIPVAGADKQGETVYSDPGIDSKNAITIIADGEAPVISGLDLLKDGNLIDRNEGSVLLNAHAVDVLSGVKNFYIEINNMDNAVKKTYKPDGEGRIKVEITKDEPIFSGDFMITAYASDNVGNESSTTLNITEFALKTDIERILEPHDPVFKCGESGILTVTTYGYADRVEVEFPEELVQKDQDLNRTYLYTDTPQYIQEEKLQFMIPLCTSADRKYTITVRAYKEGRELEQYPSFSTIEVEGNILEDFRTRLR